MADNKVRADDVGLRYTAVVPEFARFLDEPVPKKALAVPSMMSMAERRFLHGLAGSYYRGRGAIVDAGIFLGASTCCFGAGLTANRVAAGAIDGAAKPIISLERGLVTEHMMGFFERKKMPPRKLGVPFGDLVARYIAEWSALVDLRLGDVLHTGEVEGRIEILFLDLLKSAELTEYAVRNYFPRLIPGVSIVVQQDYFFHKLPFIKVAQEYFGSCFEYLGEIASSAVYRCIAPIGETQARSFALDRIPTREQIDLCRRAEARTDDPAKRLLMALSTVELLVRASQFDLAEECLAAARIDHADVLDLSWGQGRVVPFRATEAAVEKARGAFERRAASMRRN